MSIAAPPPALSRRQASGHVLLESFLCVAIVGLGAIPLATLGNIWLRWSGQHEHLTGAVQLAAERAEAGLDDWPLISGSPQRAMLCESASAGAGCVPGTRIALA